MIEIIYFTLAGVALYFISDMILEKIEIMRGERLPHRDIVFFVIILVLATVVFALLQHLLQGSS